VLNKRILLLFK